MNRLICQASLYLSKSATQKASPKEKASSSNVPDVATACSRRKAQVSASTATKISLGVKNAAKTANHAPGARRGTSLTTTAARKSAPDAKDLERPASLALFVEAATTVEEGIG